MKYYKYLPALIGVVGLINIMINRGTAFCLFILGVAVSLLLGLRSRGNNELSGWLGLFINLIPLCILGFIYLNYTFR